MSKIIVINCGYGNGPYLRATEIALAVCAATTDDWKIVVPLLYEERQQRIMEEEFGKRDEIILDTSLGKIMSSVFYDGNIYEEFLVHWLENVDDSSTQAKRYLSTEYGEAIVMEISRAPLLKLDVHPAYYNSFSRTSLILNASIGNTDIAIDDTLLKQAAQKMEELEHHFDAHLISIPGTFPPQEHDIPIPPTAAEKTWNEELKRGIYVTASGIPNVQSLCDIAQEIGLPLYTNDAERIPGAVQLPPSALASDNIIAHISRAGWGAVWSSLLTNTPLITPKYHSTDDPEIYFNNEKIVDLGIGAVWNSQTIEEIENMKYSMESYKEELLEQFGSLDGSQIAAKKIIELQV